MQLSSEATQRVGPLSGLPALMADLGADPDALLDGLGLARDDLSPGRAIAFDTVRMLLDRAVELTGCAHLGLLLGHRHDHRILGLPGQLMANAPTLGEALSDFTSIQIINSRSAVAYLHRYGEEFAFGYGIYDRGALASPVIYDIALAVGGNQIRNLCGGAASPVAVHLARKAPANADVYPELLGCPVLFNQEQNCLILSRQTMETGVRGADPARRRLILEEIRQIRKSASPGSKARTRHVLRAMIQRGPVSLSSISEALGLHPRTLGRQLAAEGTRFEALRDELRYDVARELLGLTTLSVGAVADSLSFSTQSAFTHAFARWSGMAPSSWRKRLLDDGPTPQILAGQRG